MGRLALMWWCLVAVAAVALFHVTYRVKMLEEELATLERDYALSQQAIHVLRAEWSYLSRPDRLAALADRYLDLQPVGVRQVVSFLDLPTRAPRTGTDGGRVAAATQGGLE